MACKICGEPHCIASHDFERAAEAGDDALVERRSSEDFTPGTLTHKLLRYAEIQEAAEARTHGRPATNSWAEGFRQAVAKIEALNRELAEARNKAIMEVIAWLRSPYAKGSEDGVDWADDFADQIETSLLDSKAGGLG